MKWHLKRGVIPSGAGWLWPVGVSLLAVLAVGLLLSGWIWWLATGNPTIPFLCRIGSAEWVVYPQVPDAIGRNAIEMTTVFRRNWWVEAAATNAVLQVRAFGGSGIVLNNTLVGIAPRAGENWKKPTIYDVAALLRPGTNEISVVVANRNGPPALWLSLKSGKWTLNSDETWQTSLCGAVWQPARLASAPMPIRKGNPLAMRERCAGSFVNRLPTLLLFAGLSLGIVCGVQYLWGRGSGQGALERKGLTKGQATVLVVLAAGLWIILFVHNLNLLPVRKGFDVDGHLGYIEYIRQRHALPLADEGWAMHHPPLYYLLCAYILSIHHLSATSAAGVAALRLFGLALGVIQIGLVFASLRVVFPSDAPKQVVGLILAAFMPVHLYLYHYVTNEILEATLVTASVYCCLRILTSERVAVAWHAALGLCLGAAFLSKTTTFVVAPVILATLVGRLLIQRERNVRVWLRTVGLVCFLCAVVSGWHYLRVWTHFGHILVGNYDRASGFAWWQDPGYGTRAYFSRFGLSLVAPLFSGFHGFADGLYSTLWGDGLCGGVASPDGRPPWNYDLMTAGYLLAVLPTVAIVVGAVAMLIGMVRFPRAKWFLLNGLAVSMGVALICYPLKFPYCENVKAFFGLPALVPLCVFGTLGMHILTRRWRLARIVLWIGLGVWAMNSYASMWIQGRAPYTRIALSWKLADKGGSGAAVEMLREVLREHPENIPAGLVLAEALEQMGHTKEALQQYESTWHNNPRDPDCVVAMACALARQGQSSEAIKLAQQVVQDAPDHPDVFPLLGRLFASQERLEKAIVAYEDALRITPGDPDVHRDLGRLDLQLGRYGPAVEHLLLSVRLKPGYAEAYNDLGAALWRAGKIQEARKCYERALRLKPNYAEAHYNLGGALEQAGEFKDAITHYEQALRFKPDMAEAQNRLARLRAAQ